MVRDAAQLHPQRTAIRSATGAITYADLIGLVESRASALHAAGIGPTAPVAFLAHRSADFVVTMLALSRLGTTFAAFDSEYPATRLAQQADSLGVSTILAIVQEGSCPTGLAALEDAGLDVLRIDANATGTPPPLPPDPADDDTAYCLFTSGTTGTPKRIGVGHGALAQFLEWQASAFGITCEDRVSLMSGLAHDPVMRDIFLPLSTGATLLIPEQGVLRDPRALSAWLRSERPSVIHTTPPMGRLLSGLGSGPEFPGARLVFWGGDMLPGDLVRSTQVRNPKLSQINFYGASETPQAVLYHRCVEGREGPGRLNCPVGIPPGGIDARIVGGLGETCDINEVGEIRIFTPYFVSVNGMQVSGGTEARQIYDTGDLGYRLPDGSIQLVGRRDDQVSIRGFRIEPGDVERQLLALDDVAQACVLTASGSDGQAMLVAHIVFADATTPVDLATLKRVLAARVPGYMVPALIMEHAALPLLPNGKRDRRALLKLQEERIRNAAQAASHDSGQPGLLSATERTVAEIFAKVLGRPVTHPGRSFVDLGADSLNTIQAMLRLERIIPNLPEDWQDLSITTLAGRVATTGDVPGPSGVKGALSLVQTELSVVFRAVAILAVVSLHYKVYSLGGGASAILFMLAGYSVVRYQLPKILNDGSVAPIVSSLIKIVLLTVAITTIVSMANILRGKDFHPSTLLFYSNFLDYSRSDMAERGVIYMWFIACYVQIMIILAFLLSWRSVRVLLRDHLANTLILCFITSAFLRFAVPAAYDLDMLRHGVPNLSKWMYLPTTYLPNVILGGLVLIARRDAGLRWICLTMTILYGLAVELVFDNNRSELLVLVVTLMMWVGSVPLPRIVFLTLMAISQSSLYLYLLHIPFRTSLHLAHIEPAPWIMLVLIVIISIIFSNTWERLLNTRAIGFSRARKSGGINGMTILSEIKRSE